jgi:hypothetical protein
VPGRMPNLLNLSFVDNQDEVTTMYTVSNPEVFFTRVVLDESGALERYTWHNNKWVVFWSVPKSVKCMESVVQIVTVIHIIPINFDARAYLGSNPGQPVIGT